MKPLINIRFLADVAFRRVAFTLAPLTVAALAPVATMASQPAPLTDRPFSKTQLFCSNLPWSVNGQMLRASFEKHGEVTDAFVAHNGRSSRGFGYVTFKEPASAASALSKAQTDGVSLGEDDRSREIRVEMARERPGPRPEPRGDRGATPREEATPRGERRDQGDKTPRAANGDKPGKGDGGRGAKGEGSKGAGKGEGSGRGGRGRGEGRGGDASGRRGGRGEGRGEGRGRGRGDGSAPSAADALPAPPPPAPTEEEESSES